MKLSKQDELCAGGLVWRTIDGVVHLGVIVRTRYGGDCGLPKGHVESGEAVLDAAIREVTEELGVSTAAGDFAGAISYPVGSRQKYVLFWNLDYLADVGPAHDDLGEVAERLWIPPAAAVARLTYPGDQLLVSQALPRR